LSIRSSLTNPNRRSTIPNPLLKKSKTWSSKLLKKLTILTGHGTTRNAKTVTDSKLVSKKVSAAINALKLRNTEVDANTSKPKSNLLLTVKKSKPENTRENVVEVKVNTTGENTAKVTKVNGLTRKNGLTRNSMKNSKTNLEKLFLKLLFTLLKSLTVKKFLSNPLTLSKTTRSTKSKTKLSTKVTFVTVAVLDQLLVLATSALSAKTLISAPNVKRLFHMLILSLS